MASSISEGVRSRHQILERRLTTEMRNLEIERKRDYPAERQLDGLIVSLRIVGIDGEPPTMDALSSYMIACVPGNPLARELEIIRAGIESIDGIPSK